ncbi:MULTISPECIES: hypothetical protein [unclassified Bradyrhizobium]|uniref:hypothetical protein n=1 Tax=unclassified Bradyrhizobium TaxID=2631580 RepID=UPI00339AC08A
MLDISSGSSLGFDERLAVLEERTKPKPRTIYDGIKDWSGVLTFVVAVLYTYPLGVWDRFIVTAQQQHAKEIQDLRSVVLRLTDADAELIRAVSRTTDPSVQAALGAMGNARKAAILAPNITLIEKRYQEITGAELALLGYQVNQLGDQGPLVAKMFEKAAAKMITSKNSYGAADVYRVHAGLYGPMGSLGPDIEKFRELMQKSVSVLPVTEPTKSYSEGISLAMDWANFEAIKGNLSCAELLANWLIGQYATSNPSYSQTLQAQFVQLSAYRKANKGPWVNSSDQQSSTCPKSVLPWTIEGWPWQAAK